MAAQSHCLRVPAGKGGSSSLPLPAPAPSLPTFRPFFLPAVHLHWTLTLDVALITDRDRVLNNRSSFQGTFILLVSVADSFWGGLCDPHLVVP